jgi:hypothetical protein
MAFAAPDQNQQVQPAANPASQQAPIAAGGTGVSGSTKAAATPGQNVPAQPSAQLSAYLAANQPQATAFAGNVASTVGNQVNAAGAGIAPAVNTYTGQLYTVPTDPTANSALANSPASLTPDQATTVKNELGAASAAPSPASTFETTPAYQNEAASIQQAVEQANLWNSGNDVASLSAALAPFEGPNATAGDKTLDSLLLSQTPGAYGQIQKAVAPAADLQGNLSTGTSIADQALQSAIAEDNAATAAATGSAQNFATNLATYLQNAVKTNQDAENAQLAANGAIYTDYNSGNLSAADAQAMGIPANQAAAFASDFNALDPAIQAAIVENNAPARYGDSSIKNINPVNLSAYLTQGAPGAPINEADVASAQNYSDIAALESLLGPNSPITLPISSATASQAGLGLNENASDVLNTAGFDAALNPLIPAAQKYIAAINYGEQIDPPQNQAEAETINSQRNGMQAIINYLNQLTGQSGVGITPPNQGGGYRPI